MLGSAAHREHLDARGLAERAGRCGPLGAWASVYTEFPVFASAPRGAPLERRLGHDFVGLAHGCCLLD